MFSLHGHTQAISSLATFKNKLHPNLVISGSFDAGIKIWDLRVKNAVSSFKDH